MPNIRLFHKALELLSGTALLLCTLVAQAQVLNIGLVPSEDPRVVIQDNQVLIPEFDKHRVTTIELPK